jgi:hypothetical protein
MRICREGIGLGERIRFAGRKWRIDLYPMIEHFACNWMNLGTPGSYRDDVQDAALCWIKTPSRRGAAAVRHVT